MEETKTCIKCGLEKDIDLFSFRTDTLKYRNQCKKCHKGYTITLQEQRAADDNMYAIGKKRCGACGKTLNIESFSKDKYTRTKLASRCRACTKLTYSTEEHKSKTFTRRLKYLYKATDDEISEFIGKVICDICGNKFKSQTDKHFDHNHTDGTYRGALCAACNKGLGHFCDNTETLVNAARYLAKHKNKT